MKLISLDKKQVKMVYKSYMVNDFAPGELKPLLTINNLLKHGLYKTLGLFDNGKLLAYAFIMTNKDSVALLDYFAVLKDYRGQGIGTKFLSLIKQEIADYSEIIIEVESVESASGDERLTRERRISFYLNCGAVMTDISATVFAVDFQIMFLPLAKKRKTEDIRKAYTSLYRLVLPKFLYSKNIILK